MVWVVVAMLEGNLGIGVKLERVRVFADREPAEAMARDWAESAGGRQGHPDERTWIGHPPERPNGDPIDPAAPYLWAYVLEREIVGSEAQDLGLADRG